MDIQTAKQIRIADFLHSLGYSPVKQQGINLWYKSPLREEAEASFMINTERNQWYDFGSEEFCLPKEKDTGRTCGVCSVIVPCPACLLAGKRNKYGTGKKRM